MGCAGGVMGGGVGAAAVSLCGVWSEESDDRVNENVGYLVAIYAIYEDRDEFNSSRCT